MASLLLQLQLPGTLLPLPLLLLRLQWEHWLQRLATLQSLWLLLKRPRLCLQLDSLLQLQRPGRRLQLPKLWRRLLLLRQRLCRRLRAQSLRILEQRWRLLQLQALWCHLWLQRLWRGLSLQEG